MSMVRKRKAKSFEPFRPAIYKIAETRKAPTAASVLVDRQTCTINGPPPGKCRS